MGQLTPTTLAQLAQHLHAMGLSSQAYQPTAAPPTTPNLTAVPPSSPSQRGFANFQAMIRQANIDEQNRQMYEGYSEPEWMKNLPEVPADVHQRLMERLGLTEPAAPAVPSAGANPMTPLARGPQMPTFPQPNPVGTVLPFRQKKDPNEPPVE